MLHAIMAGVIDWLSLAANSLWIIGCSILLAQFSIRRWAKQANVEVDTPTSQFIIKVISYTLILVGVVIVNELIWQKLLWAVVIGLQVLSEYLNYKSVR